MTGPARRFAFIDALRGWAILGVLLVHTALMVPGLPGPVVRLAASGAHGVQLFYVVSALTLFLSLDLRRGQEAGSIAPFLARRFFRIAPLFWGGLLFYPLVLEGLGPRGWAPDGIGWPHILATATFLHGWHPTTINSVVPGSWSIAIEMTFYLAVPFLYRRIKTLVSALWWLLGTLLAAAVLDLLAIRIFPLLFPRHAFLVACFRTMWFPAQLPVFLVGLVLYFTLKRFLLGDAPAPADRGTGTALLALSLFLFVGLSNGGYEFLPGDVVYAGAFGLFAYGLAVAPNRLFVNPVTCYLGKISYSVYVCHMALVGHVASRPAHFLLKAAPALETNPLCWWVVFSIVSLILSALVATVTYHAIEVPGMALGKRIAERLRAQSRSAPEPMSRCAA